MENLTGKQLGIYQVLAPIGQGGMAAVYKAYQPNMDRYVAVKVLPRHFASDPDYVGRFRQEAKIVAQLQHPRILPVFDFGETDGYTYLVMPFVEGGTLNEQMHGRPLPFRQIKLYISQVCEALDYAHAHGIVHRDIKPSNILVDERGNCLLMDFGIAKILEGTSRFTQSGAAIGTPAYMSPEQSRGEKVSSRSDIYSLGVILYEMATGSKPFDAETPAAVMMKHILDPLLPPRQINSLIPENLEKVILKALAKLPENRFETAGSMLEALQAAIPDQMLSQDAQKTGAFTPAATWAVENQHTNTNPPRAVQPGSKSSKRFWILGGIVGLMFCVLASAAIILGMFINGTSQQTPTLPSTQTSSSSNLKQDLTATPESKNPAPVSTIPPANTGVQPIVQPVLPRDIQTLDDSTNKVEQVITALDASGLIHVAWVEHLNNHTEGYHAVLSLDGKWSNKESFTSDFNTIGNTLQLLKNPQGTICAFFSAGDDWYERCFEKGAQGPANKVAHASLAYLTFAYDLDGSIQYISYVNVYKRVTFNNVLLSDSALTDGPFQFLIDKSGVYHLIWSQMSRDKFAVIYRFSSDKGVTWTPAKELSKIGSGLITGPILLQDPQGNMALLFRSSQLLYRHWTQASGWGDAVDITGQNRDPRLISLALGPDGLPQVIWQEFNGMYYTRQLADNTWTPPVFINNSSVTKIITPQITVDSQGKIYLSWADIGSETPGIKFVKLP